MAILNANGAPPITINTADTYNFGDVSSGEVGVCEFHLVSSAFSGSITVKGRARGTTNAFVAIPYAKQHLNGAVADGSTVSTAITDTSIIQVDSSGLDIALDCTSYASGSMAVTPTRAVG